MSDDDCSQLIFCCLNCLGFLLILLQLVRQMGLEAFHPIHPLLGHCFTVVPVLDGPLHCSMLLLENCSGLAFSVGGLCLLLEELCEGFSQLCVRGCKDGPQLPGVGVLAL